MTKRLPYHAWYSWWYHKYKTIGTHFWLNFKNFKQRLYFSENHSLVDIAFKYHFVGSPRPKFCNLKLLLCSWFFYIAFFLIDCKDSKTSKIVWNFPLQYYLFVWIRQMERDIVIIVIYFSKNYCCSHRARKLTLNLPRVF